MKASAVEDRHGVRGRGRPGGGGFTLIVAMSGMFAKSKIENTMAFLRTLEGGCIQYREKYGQGRDYPPMDVVSTCNPDNSTSDTSSRNLTKYLGSPLRFYRGYASNPALSTLPGMNQYDEQKPILSLEESRRDIKDPTCLIDFWDRRILYFSGKSSECTFRGRGYTRHDKLCGAAESVHMDIASDGPYFKGKDPTDGKDCRVATFKPQFGEE